MVVRRLHSVHSPPGRRHGPSTDVSGFPTGHPGLALLLLRLVVGGATSSQAGLLIAADHGAANTSVIIVLLAFVIGLALIIGFMTPIASACSAQAVYF